MNTEDILYEKSDYTEIISQLFQQEFQKKVLISQLHMLKKGDGNTVFYVISKEGFHFLVDIIGRKIQDNAILYWVESIDFSGKLHEFFYDRDIVVITFSRGEKFNNEYLAYMYSYGYHYPSIKFIPTERYPSYSKMLSSQYKKQHINLPSDLMVMD